MGISSMKLKQEYTIDNKVVKLLSKANGVSLFVDKVEPDTEERYLYLVDSSGEVLDTILLDLYRVQECACLVVGESEDE